MILKMSWVVVTGSSACEGKFCISDLPDMGGRSDGSRTGQEMKAKDKFCLYYILVFRLQFFVSSVGKH